MVVLITNVTDAPGKNSTQVDIYNKTLSPGAQIQLPADLVTKKIRSLEESGLIAIGNLPPWYLTAKRSKPLSEEEKQKRLVQPPIPIKPEKSKKERLVDISEEPVAKRG